MGVTVLATSDGKLDSADRTALDALKQRISTGEPKILLHLHGGLVKEGQARAMAGRLSTAGDNSYNAPEEWEQVYVVWRTGALETLTENWRDLAKNDRLYRTLLRRLIWAVSEHVGPVAAGGRGLASSDPLPPSVIERELKPGVEHPFKDFDNARDLAAAGRGGVSSNADEALELALREDGELDEEARAVEAAIASDMPVQARGGVRGNAATGAVSLKNLDESVIDELRLEATTEAASRGSFAGAVALKVIWRAVTIGKRVLDRYRTGRDHGLHATVAEEIARELYGDLIGSIIWGMMKTDAADHFAEGSLGAELLKMVAANPDARLLIVGHSAGSIFASELLLWAGREGIDLKADVVFLAPAVRMELFARALDAAEGSIKRFRLYAMKDELERADTLLGRDLGFVYPSSLLYLVSGLFEEHASKELTDAPLLGMQRFLEGRTSWDDDEREGAAIKRVRAFLDKEDNRTVFSKVTGGPGLSSDAMSHGGFDDEKVTLASVATFLV